MTKIYSGWAVRFDHPDFDAVYISGDCYPLPTCYSQCNAQRYETRAQALTAAAHAESNWDLEYRKPKLVHLYFHA